MNIFDWLRRQWRFQSPQHLYMPIDPRQVEGEEDLAPTPLVAGEHYFRLWLVEMQLVNDRDWFGAWQPAAYSIVQLMLGDHKETLSHVLGPSLLSEFAQAAASRPLRLNYPLTPLLPFNGGSLELECGLLAIPGRSDVRALLKTLTDFSQLLVVPEISGALKIAAVLVDSMMELVRETGAKPELHFRGEFPGEPLSTLAPGYFALIAAPDPGVSASQLWVRDGRLHVGPSLKEARPLEGRGYQLFRLESTSERDDWDSLTSIAEPYEHALSLLSRSAYMGGEAEQRRLLAASRRRLGDAKRAALAAPELTSVIGRNRVVHALTAGYASALSKSAPGAIPEAPETLGAAMQRGISIDEARARGYFTSQDWGLADDSLHDVMLPEEQGFRAGGETGDILGSFLYLHASAELGGTLHRPPQPPNPNPEVLSPQPQPPKPELITIERTPHLDVLKKLPLRPGDGFTVRVFVDRAPPRAGEDSRPFRAQVPAATEALDVEVSIDGSAHFAFPGTRSKILTIPVDESRDASVTFKIAVRKNLETYSGARLAAYFTFEGRPSGQVIVGIPLTKEANTENQPTSGDPPPASQLPPDTRPAPATLAPPALRFTPGLRQPDLIIEITDPVGDTRALRCKLTSPHAEALGLDTRRKRWSLPAKTDELIQTLFQEFTQRDILPLKRFLSLRGAGHGLWKAAPPHLKEAIHKLIHADKLHSILIVSQDPYFLWELMIPSEEGAPGGRDPLPLGVTCAVARWIGTDNLSPPQNVPMTRSLVIAPDYKGPPRPNSLKHASAEAKFVRDTIPGDILVPAEYTKVAASLFASRVDLVHFVCHGVASRRIGVQMLALEDLDLSSIEVAGMGLPPVPDTPFVFLNACEVGQPAVALNGVGGFASAFIDRGAKAVVAPLWSVLDTVAHTVARDFYERVKAQPQTPYAELIRQIRSLAYTGATAGVDTYAAYCFYGDPLASPN